jgi:ABC-type Zn uptake system ZnuABC Zn-binding protein ZnuA
VKRLGKQGVPMETMVIVGDTHHWMKHENAVKLAGAIGDYFSRKFLKKL